MKISKLSCLRYKITDIKLFKSGQAPGLEWTSRWSPTSLKDISTWESEGVKTIQVTEGSLDPLILKVRTFMPTEGGMGA
jgi:hypothetical protein